jgi:hypothetical protein
MPVLQPGCTECHGAEYVNPWPDGDWVWLQVTKYIHGERTDFDHTILSGQEMFESWDEQQDQANDGDGHTDTIECRASAYAGNVETGGDV